MKVKGFACKADTTKDDFFIGLVFLGATNNSMRSLMMGANVEKIPRLDSLSIFISCIDYAPNELNPPHTHPCVTKMTFILDVSFITTANKVITKTITKDDVFIFPRGLIHFQKNNSDAPTVVIAIFNNKHPGLEKAIRVPRFREYFEEGKGVVEYAVAVAATKANMWWLAKEQMQEIGRLGEGGRRWMLQ
uniref:Germin-like protein 5-1 n=1 Tax=Elaeis guineensis var. tenera TaxID=51953 RepID=A0A6I9S4G0_ELAGV|nr:germin-like protein 5-1 [Elaeis guineensis]